MSRWQLLAVVLSVIAWQAVDAVQARLPLSLGWALLDELAHAAVALLALLWLQPAWGWRPILAGLAAATTIDVDHLIAAGSVLPSEMMSLQARPLMHSVLGVLIVANLGAAFGGWRVGCAAAIGSAMHIARDSIAEPGVPLLVPFNQDWHVLLPAWALYVAIVASACVCVVLASGAQSGFGRRPRPGPSPRSEPAPRPHALRRPAPQD